MKAQKENLYSSSNAVFVGGFVMTMVCQVQAHFHAERLKAPVAMNTAVNPAPAAASPPADKKAI
jgi:hypothetical protein